VVTNITHEHLDYHGSYEAYRAAKARLCTMLSQTAKKDNGIPALAVLNRDDSSYEYLDSVTQVRKVGFGLRSGSDVTAEDIRYEPDSLRFQRDWAWFPPGNFFLTGWPFQCFQYPGSAQRDGDWIENFS